MRTRIISLLLIVFLLSSSIGLISCSETIESESEVTDTTAASTDTSIVDVIDGDNDKVVDNLGVYDFEGKVFNMMTFENANFNYSVTADEMLALTLNDAMYYATTTLENRFNIDLVQSLYSDGDGSPRISITAGDETIDLVRIRCTEAVTWWQENLLTTADNIPVIDMEKPYWDKTINDSLTIADTHYVALSSFDLCTYDLTFSLLFNKKLVDDFKLKNPYELVTSGKWTMDEMNEMMLSAVSDLNGDNIFNQDDRFGYVANPKMVAPGFWIGAGVKSINKDENDIPHLDIDSEQFISVWEKLLSICYSDNQYFGVDDGPDISTAARQIFSEDRSLFMDMSFFFAGELRQMDSDFGIIPYPKYDVLQDKYSTRLCYYMPTVVPTTVVDEELERAGIMLEALACEYYNTVIPAYYDVALQGKVARDVESQDMLDIIFQSRVIDIGDSTLCGNVRDGIIRQMFENNTVSISSKAASLNKVVDKILSRLPGVSSQD